MCDETTCSLWDSGRHDEAAGTWRESDVRRSCLDNASGKKKKVCHRIRDQKYA